MAIKIKAVALKNPQDLTAAPKFYARAVNNGEISLDDLSDYIAMISTVSRGDVYAVLVSLTDFIPKQLGEGKIVRLGEMGSFNISLSSSPSDTEDEVSAINVKKLKMNFRPSLKLKSKIEAFPITKIS